MFFCNASRVNDFTSNSTLASSEAPKGPSIKYVTLQGGGGLRKCDSLWQGGKDHVTSHVQFFHNSQFYVIFYILSCIKQIWAATSELWEIKLVRVFQGLLETPIEYGLLLLLKI